jgi:hypothetical protein
VSDLPLTQNARTLKMFNGTSAGNPSSRPSGVLSQDRNLVKQALTSPGLVLAFSLWSGNMDWMQGTSDFDRTHQIHPLWPFLP